MKLELLDYLSLTDTVNEISTMYSFRVIKVDSELTIILDKPSIEWYEFYSTFEDAEVLKAIEEGKYKIDFFLRTRKSQFIRYIDEQGYYYITYEMEGKLSLFTESMFTHEEMEEIIKRGF